MQDCAVHCPECQVTLSARARFPTAVGLAEAHARVFGHPVHLMDATRWAVLETVLPEPQLPL